LQNPEISSTLEGLILSLLEKHPARRPSSGNVVALALVEEAERARRLARINPGLKRPSAQSPPRQPLSRTASVVGDFQAGLSPANGTPQADPITAVPSVRDGPPSAVSRRWDSTGPRPSPVENRLEPAGASGATALGPDSHPIAREMLATLLATPIVISPEERYLCGQYLGYLLGGSRRRGIFLRRPLDARNADRARLLLAMTWLSNVEPTQEAIERASTLLEDRPELRAALSPVVVIKYLASRDTLGKLKRFRRIRRRLQESSAYARKAMLDPNGVLNPGMMPRTLDDLAVIAPHRDTLDAHRVSLWNRVTEVWRREDEFRTAVLRYATRCEHLDTQSADLWPEVVYPLIERAHWQRRFRPRHEALWDYVVGKLLHVPVPGVRLDRMMIVAIPLDVADQFDHDLTTLVDDPRLDEDEPIPSESQVRAAHPRPIYVGGRIPRDERPADDDAPRVKVMVPLSPADPFLFAQNTLHQLWEGAMQMQDNGAPPRLVHRTIPVGPYELAVVPTRRGRSAVRAVLQCTQRGKEIEIITPSAVTRDSSPRTVIAIWIYQDASVAVVHFDFQHKKRFILWHAPDAQQFNFDYPEELEQRLSTLSLEVPDRLDQILSEK
jgi:serine/threonine-protein kinase